MHAAVASTPASSNDAGVSSASTAADAGTQGQLIATASSPIATAPLGADVDAASDADDSSRASGADALGSTDAARQTRSTARTSTASDALDGADPESWTDGGHRADMDVVDRRRHVSGNGMVSIVVSSAGRVAAGRDGTADGKRCGDSRAASRSGEGVGSIRRRTIRSRDARVCRRAVCSERS
ncbi:MAG: hypothetical protein QM736_27605 [Vicinamibacterales bacterium]